MAEIPSVGRALLETIAGPESAGNYDIIYGGSRFQDFSDHPRQYITITSGPNKGQKSSAAGKYQFLGSTWDDQASRLGLTDFSPSNQDAAAWNLAQEEYRRDTGRNLAADLEAGDLSRVAPSLRNQWTSMPGGIEQGISGDAFSTAYQRALANAGAGSPPIMAYNPQLPNVGPSGGPALNAINRAAGMPTPNTQRPGQGGGGIWGNPLGFVRQQVAGLTAPVQQLAASPQVQQAAIGPLMGSLAGRNLLSQKLMNMNIGAAPQVSQGWGSGGTRAMAVNGQGARPVTLGAGPIMRGPSPAPSYDSVLAVSGGHGGFGGGGSGDPNSHMSMPVYRANAATLGGGGFNQSGIDNALSQGKTLYRLA